MYTINTLKHPQKRKILQMLKGDLFNLFTGVMFMLNLCQSTASLKAEQ